MQAIRLKTIYFLLLSVTLSLLSGCISQSRNIQYKMKAEVDTEGIPVVHLNRDTTEDMANYQHIIKPDDKLAIRFLNNTDISGGITLTGSNSNNTDLSFLVDQQGNVKLPMVGKVNVATQTKNQAAITIEDAYKRDFINPNIEVKLVGLSVTVEGEVRAPGIYPLNREKTTLIEVIADAGGMTSFAQKNEVKVIRRKIGKSEPEVLIFNLSTIESLESPELIVRDKDIIYVVPKNVRVLGETLSPYTALLSLISSFGALGLTILNLSRR